MRVMALPTFLFLIQRLQAIETVFQHGFLSRNVLKVADVEDPTVFTNAQPIDCVLCEHFLL